MKTRVLSLLFAMPLASASLNAQASETLDQNLLNLAVASTLLSWGYSIYANDTRLPDVMDINWQQQRLGVNLGHFSQAHAFNLNYAKPLKSPLVTRQNFDLNAHWELGLGAWQSQRKQPLNKSGYIISLTPMLNYQFTRLSYQPYIEMGIGMAFISGSEMDNKLKSTQFQFSDRLGAGIEINNWRLGYRFEHLSNGGISTPNEAVDIHALHASYLF